MNKRIICCILAIIMVFALLPAQVRAGDGGNWGNVTWGLSEGVLTISGTGAMPDATLTWSKENYLTDSTAPWFWYDFHTVIIESGITAVGANNFYGADGLETVQLPETLTVIGQSAFHDCIDLRSIELPTGLRTIDYFAFQGCESLTGTPLMLPETVTTIRDSAFFGCLSIKGVRFPDSLSHLGYTAFGQTGLMDVHIPATLDSISGSPFYNCVSLEAITADPANPNYTADEQGVLYNKDKTHIIQIPGGYSGELTIPDSVTYLVDTDLLWGCAQLTKIHIPATVREISPYLFYSCPSLEAIEVDAANPIYDDIDGVLYGPDSLYLNGFSEEAQRALVCCPPAFQRESFFLPDDLDTIEGAAFWNCFYLQDVTIPAGVDASVNGIFQGCTSLYEIHVDGNNPWLQSIDGVVFNKADVTVSIFDYTGIVTDTRTFTAGEYLYCYPTGRSGYYAIPDGTVYLATSSFATSAVEAIRFPDSVTYISMYAMANCTELEWMLFTGSRPYAQRESFADVTADVYYPCGNPTWEDVLLEQGEAFPDSMDMLNYIAWGPYPADEPLWSGWNPFYDVPDDSFYREAVLWALQRGITTGATEVTFNPNGSCLRAQVVTFLHRAKGNPEPVQTANPFTDVKTTDFFYKPVLWAVEQGITNGTSATTFGSYDVCNRAAVVTFLWRTAGSPTPSLTEHPFTDIPAGAFYETAVLWALENEITKGISATEFGPTSPCNRAQVVTFLYRAYN